MTSRSFVDTRRARRAKMPRVEIGVHLPPEELARKLRALADAGAQRVYVWPVVDEIEQLERFANEVLPALG
jgi:hypothetical protein